MRPPQRHTGGRGTAADDAACNTSPRHREHSPSRRPAVRPRHLPDDGRSVAARDADHDAARLDRAFRAHHRRGEEVRRVEHAERGRLERGAPERKPERGRTEAQAAAGQGAVHGRREAPAGAGGAGIDR